MSRLFCCVLFLLSNLAIADTAVQAEIDRSVWTPFHAAFEQRDGQELNAIYAESVLRVTPDGIDTQGQFKTFNLTRFDANIAKGEQIALDFWFDSRRTNSTTSYDVGFYRIRINPPKNSTSEQGAPETKPVTFYGQFHIVVKKIQGRWKIVQDWDTDTIGGRSITAEDFARRPPIHF